MTKTRATIIKAAAGTGKTTELIRIYLKYLQNFSAEEIITITFTRKAAAELLERVSQVLWALRDDDSIQHRDAIKALGDDLELYREYAPTDENVIIKALAQLSNAPVGTTDSFVRTLLSDFALDATIPITGDLEIPLDFPIENYPGNKYDFYREVAGKMVSSPLISVSEDMKFLLKYLTLKDIIDAISIPCDEYDDSNTGDTYTVYSELMAQYVENIPGGYSGLKGLLNELIPDLEQLNKYVKKTGSFATSEVWRWMQNEDSTPPIINLLAVLGAATKKSPLYVKNFVHSINELRAEHDLGEINYDKLMFFKVEMGVDLIKIPISAFAEKLEVSYVENDEIKQEVEKIRRILFELRQSVKLKAEQKAVEAGALGHNDFIKAAISLCRSAAKISEHPLRTKYKILLVDEVQDSNPIQIQFYEALCEINDDISASFVGDKRQSIYLFNGADPYGIDKLLNRAWAVEKPPLAVNYRSHKSLVAAQQALFGKNLTDLAGLEGFRGVEDINTNTLKAADSSDAGDEFPVTIVIKGKVAGQFSQDSGDYEALVEFGRKMMRIWASDESGNDTASVLCSTWKTAEDAKRTLNSIFEQEGIKYRAFVDNGGNWRYSRVIEDISIIIAALMDRSDEVAWLGLWKHPMVGLSDNAFALVKQGVGIPEEKPWAKKLGHLLDVSALSAEYCEQDQAAYNFARIPLLKACNRFGNESLVMILETLASELGWWTILGQSPVDDAIYIFHQALEWIRDMESEGMGAKDILNVLTGRNSETESPKFSIHRESKHISCTTVYQAKGLKWDHVCILNPGQFNQGGRLGEGYLKTVYECIRVRINKKYFTISPIKIDPENIMNPKRDPLGALKGIIESRRQNEELFRKIYVAVTRAVKSVIFGFGGAPQAGSPREILMKAWGEKKDKTSSAKSGEENSESLSPREICKSDIFGVQYLKINEISERPIFPELSLVKENPDISNIGQSIKINSGERFRMKAPSMVYEDLNLQIRDKIAREIVKSGSFIIGENEPLALPQKFDLHLMPEYKWGLIVHGWFEMWQFKGIFDEPQFVEKLKENTERYLKEKWALTEKEAEKREIITNWLMALGIRLANSNDKTVWDIVSKEGNSLYFEYPIIGQATFDEKNGSPFLLSGKCDLLVKEETGNWILIDFKAGSHSPRAKSLTSEQKISDANLKIYGPQLKGYAEAINGAFEKDLKFKGERISTSVLWFVRNGSAVIWKN